MKKFVVSDAMDALNRITSRRRVECDDFGGFGFSGRHGPIVVNNLFNKIIVLR